MKILFGSRNPHKLAEVRALLGTAVAVVGAAEIALPDVPETGSTLEANAQLKAETYANAAGIPCFADDTGLLVDALGGAPGVYSARYAGPNATAGENVAKLLAELAPHQNRAARFRTAIAYAEPNKGTLFCVLGELEGAIITQPRGQNGFGYDPIFVPKNDTRTLAELSAAEKNAISHRGRALRAFHQQWRNS